MLRLFLADPDAVRWELSALGPYGNGPFCLVIQHAGGEIVEDFLDLTPALSRESELEALLMTAQMKASADMAWTAPREAWTGPRAWVTRDDQRFATE